VPGKGENKASERGLLALDRQIRALEECGCGALLGKALRDGRKREGGESLAPRRLARQVSILGRLVGFLLRRYGQPIAIANHTMASASSRTARVSTKRYPSYPASQREGKARLYGVHRIMSTRLAGNTNMSRTLTSLSAFRSKRGS